MGFNREELLDKIRGQTVTIPDLHPIFEKWTGPLNPNYYPLVKVVDEKLESLVPDQKKLAKLKTADFALFATNWWPRADFNELRIVCFLAIWLFLWDDELDEPTGQHAENFDSAQKYREETLVFLEESLGLGFKKAKSSTSIYSSIQTIGAQLRTTIETCLSVFISGKTTEPAAYHIIHGFDSIAKQVRITFDNYLMPNTAALQPPRASHPIIESFRTIGDELRDAYTKEQRQTFLEEMKFYISTTVTEQRFKLTGKIPTVEQYWKLRMGTSAVAACLGVIEFAHKIRGPYRTTREPTLVTLCDEANIIVVIANDILSLKKEIKVGAIDSLIPLSCVEDANIQGAIDRAHLDLLAAVDRFETAAETVLSTPNETQMSDQELRTFVDGCRECWVGNFKWRYGLGSINQQNGSFTVVL